MIAYSYFRDGYCLKIETKEDVKPELEVSTEGRFKIDHISKNLKKCSIITIKKDSSITKKGS